MKTELIKKAMVVMGIVIAMIILVPGISLAQGAPPATPIDGGLSLLLAAGGVYGIKKIRDQRKSK